MAEAGSRQVMKMIIENRTTIADADALYYVQAVLRGGTVSETAGRRHHCHCTVFGDGENQVVVSVFLNRKSERFVIHRNEGDHGKETD